jgi:hypothetical protein
MVSDFSRAFIAERNNILGHTYSGSVHVKKVAYILWYSGSGMLESLQCAILVQVSTRLISDTSCHMTHHAVLLLTLHLL